MNTLADAQRAIDEWQNKRNEAAAALAQYEQEAGDLVFAGGETGKVAGQLERLRTEVDLAEAALQAAHRAVAKVKAEERLQRLETLRAEAAAVAQEEQEIAAWLEEHAPAVDAKRCRLKDLMRRSMALDTQIFAVEARIRDAEKAEQETPSAPQHTATGRVHVPVRDSRPAATQGNRMAAALASRYVPCEATT